MNYDESLIPNSDLAHYVGSGTDMENFKQIGLKAVDKLEHLGGLRSTDRVLEVGCGIGRIAIPLTGFLTEGSYEGFDVVRHGIEWCQQAITPKHPRFRFQWVDLYNQTYNPESQTPASEYRFPYPDETFDFTFLTSVFTHLLPSDVQHYFCEIRRTLKSGGICFFTAFLINDDVRHHLSTSQRPFQNVGEYWTLNPARHEDGVGYDQALLERWLRAENFAIRLMQYSHWWATGTGQDLVVARKL